MLFQILDLTFTMKFYKFSQVPVFGASASIRGGPKRLKMTNFGRVSDRFTGCPSNILYMTLYVFSCFSIHRHALKHAPACAKDAA